MTEEEFVMFKEVNRLAKLVLAGQERNRRMMLSLLVGIYAMLVASVALFIAVITR